MTVLADWEIKERCVNADPEYKMIEPFVGGQIKTYTEINDTPRRAISYGLSSYGYDVRLSNYFKIFTDIHNELVDPKNFLPTCYIERHARDHKPFIIPPRSFILGHSIEIINVPRDVVVVCIGKSTYARCGIIVNVTPLEPEWSGQITIEISNTSALPAALYPGEGITQLMFHKADEVCKVSYKDKVGKYQHQRKIVDAKV